MGVICKIKRDFLGYSKGGDSGAVWGSTGRVGGRQGLRKAGVAPGGGFGVPARQWWLGRPESGKREVVFVRRWEEYRTGAGSG